MLGARARLRRDRIAVALLALVLAALAGTGAAAGATLVGRQPGGSVLLPDNQTLTPAGRQVEFRGHPTGVAVSPDGRRAVLHAADTGSGSSLWSLSTSTATLRQAYDPSVSSASFDGLAFSPDGRTVYSSSAAGAVTATQVAADGTLGASTSISIPAPVSITCCNAYPGGLAVSADGRALYVALSRENALGVIDLATNTLLKKIPVGNAPHSVVVSGRTAFVTNEGGRPAQALDFTNRSAGTPIVADPSTGAARTGTVSVVDLDLQQQVATIDVDLHPTALLLGGGYLWVANTASDTVSVIDPAERRVVNTLSVAPFRNAPDGVMPTGIALLPDQRLAVTLGRANAVAIFDVRHATSVRTPAGMLPTGWFPAGVAVDALHRQLVVANDQGVGSVADADAGSRSRNVHAAIGSASLIPFPDSRALRSGTEAVLRNNGWTAGLPPVQRAGVAPVAIPARIGEPSLIKHVVYVIRENRTYDQILGDIGRGNSDPSLVLWGAGVTPNAHALATQFPLLDNFYVSATKSNDGHQWATQATNTDYLQKALGNEQRVDYLSGGTPPSSGFDALLYQRVGHLWDNALRHGKTFDDYGEYTTEDEPPPARSDVPSLDAHVVREFQGFNLQTPDQVRAQIFKAHLATYELKGQMPDLIMLTLPNDHTGGSDPLFDTPSSEVADNDAGLGRIVDAISHSSFWKDTAVFVVEDDAQGGVDHVDGHRSPAFVISPYAKSGGVDSTYYTQVNVVRTIEQILGLPPMNPIDLAAVPMRSLFTDSPDLTPYDALAPTAATDIPNAPLASLTGLRREWAEAVAHQDLEHLDAADPQLLNRDIWYAVRGIDTPYPGDARVLHPSEVHTSPDSAAYLTPVEVSGDGDEDG